MYYSKSTGGFYSADIHGPRHIAVPDPNWQRPTVEVDGERVPDEAAVQPTTFVDNSDCKIPEDAVEVSDEDYQALFAAQSQGKLIKTDEEGKPVAVQPVVSQHDAIKAQILTLEAKVTPRRVREAILGSDNGWLADLESQIATLRSQLQ